MPDPSTDRWSELFEVQYVGLVIRNVVLCQKVLLLRRFKANCTVLAILANIPSPWDSENSVSIAVELRNQLKVNHWQSAQEDYGQTPSGGCSFSWWWLWSACLVAQFLWPSSMLISKHSANMRHVLSWLRFSIPPIPCIYSLYLNIGNHVTTSNEDCLQSLEIRVSMHSFSWYHYTVFNICYCLLPDMP